MIFDRILEDILGFIRRFLWWQADPSENNRQPFESMQKVEGDFGVISLVEGRDTPRAVRSWIFSSKRIELNSTCMVAKNCPDDLHFYLDFLGPLPHSNSTRSQQEAEERKARRRTGQRVDTHRLQILQTSHFLNENGFYDYKLVFWRDYDFYLPIGLTPDKIARILTDKLAYRCLAIANPLELEPENWETLIDEIWQEIRGSQFARHARA
jgi:hypothetical protein